MDGDHISPYEKFSGMKFKASRDLRFGFGDYVQADLPTTDSSMKGRTHGCIAGVPLGNKSGSMRMYSLATGRLVMRTHLTVLPLPDVVITHLNKTARADGFARGGSVANRRSNTQEEPLDLELPRVMPIDGRPTQVPPEPLQPLASAAGVGLAGDDEALCVPTPAEQNQGSRRSARLSVRFADEQPVGPVGQVMPSAIPVEDVDDTHEDNIGEGSGVREGDMPARPVRVSPTAPRPVGLGLPQQGSPLRRSTRAGRGVPAERYEDIYAVLDRGAAYVERDRVSVKRHLASRAEWRDVESSPSLCR